MKDEIKEILNKIRKNNNHYEDTSHYNQLNLKECKILSDYIINLQEIEKEHKNCTRKHWQQKCAEHYANEMIYKSRNEKANTLLDEMLERAYINGEYIMYDYSTSELLEVKQALEGEKNE